MTVDAVLGLLDSYEPDYDQAAQLAAQLGPHIKPIFEPIITSDEAVLAARVTYLVSLIPLFNPNTVPEAVELLREAAQPMRPTHVRLAAADGGHNLESPEAASIVLLPLLQDDDVRVRKVALRSVGPHAGPQLCNRIREIFQADSALRQIAEQVLEASCRE